MHIRFAGDFIIDPELIKRRGSDFAIQVREAAIGLTDEIKGLPRDVRLSYETQTDAYGYLEADQIRIYHRDKEGKQINFRLASMEPDWVTRLPEKKKGIIHRKVVRPEESLPDFISRAIQQAHKLLRIEQAEKDLTKPIGDI